MPHEISRKEVPPRLPFEHKFCFVGVTLIYRHEFPIDTELGDIETQLLTVQTSTRLFQPLLVLLLRREDAEIAVFTFEHALEFTLKVRENCSSWK